MLKSIGVLIDETRRSTREVTLTHITEALSSLADKCGEDYKPGLKVAIDFIKEYKEGMQ